MFRRLFTIVPLFFLLGSIVLLVFSNIVGASEKSVLKKFYWIEVDASGLTNVPFSPIRWTSYRLCGVDGNKNSNCQSSSPALPFSPRDNFGSDSGIPQGFIDNRDVYYYLTRISYAFLLIGLFFAVISLLALFISICLPRVIAAIGSFLTFLSLLFTITAAACLTAAHVKGRNEFNNAGHSAKLGAVAFGVLWAAVACLIISFVTSIIASATSRRNHSNEYYSKEAAGGGAAATLHDSHNYEEPTLYEDPQSTQPATDTSKFRFFRVRPNKEPVE
ncbi:SUR7/PalI family-domain-containing protein [Scheffersomyces xylosifermentans]|uniref:SUR7/PalI family-domain-containing protein n=1 Tax=Scheffersomyces xylosifermentans TaxID=1304137 RepID=UPI00315DF63B